MLGKGFCVPVGAYIGNYNLLFIVFGFAPISILNISSIPISHRSMPGANNLGLFLCKVCSVYQKDQQRA